MKYLQCTMSTYATFILLDPSDGEDEDDVNSDDGTQSEQEDTDHDGRHLCL